MRTRQPLFITPVSACANQLRFASHTEYFEGFSNLGFFKTSAISKLIYIVGSNNEHPFRVHITDQGKKILNFLDSGLVWSIEDNAVSPIATIYWYRQILEYGIIPDTVFQCLARVEHPELINDSDFKSIRDQMVLCKISYSSRGEGANKIWAKSDDISIRYLQLDLKRKTINQFRKNPSVCD